MDPQDDPEARIRALEQPLADQARTSELGAAQNTGGSAYLRPPVDYGNQYQPPTSSVPYTPPGADPYAPPGYGAPWGGPPLRQVSKGFGAWPLVIGVIVLVVIAGVAGIVVWSVKSALPGGTIPTFRSIPSFPSISSIPSEAPSAEPETPGGPTSGTVAPPPPGGQLSVAGVNERKTLQCNDSIVSVSGVSNTVTITGHCKSVTVSGMDNQVTLDDAAAINASGFDNVVTYHSGSPEINSGGSNTVQQG
jgi:Protein of unknown function (DUF3060)